MTVERHAQHDLRRIACSSDVGLDRLVGPVSFRLLARALKQCGIVIRRAGRFPSAVEVVRHDG